MAHILSFLWMFSFLLNYLTFNSYLVARDRPEKGQTNRPVLIEKENIYFNQEMVLLEPKVLT